MPPRLDIVIVNWNSGDRLRRNLESLRAGGDLAGVEIFVVDNASDDGSAEGAEGPGTRLVRLPRNAGFAAGCNRGAREGSAPLLLFLNPDIVHPPGNLRALLDGFSAPGDADGACGVLVGPDGRPPERFQFRRLPTRTWALAELLLPPVIRRHTRTFRRHFCLDLDVAAPVAVEQPAAACWMLRRDVFEAAGGFDERFHPAWFEDVDLAARLHDRGSRTVRVPGARFVHEGGYSATALGEGPFARHYWTNALRFYRKRYPVFGWFYRCLFPAGMLWRCLGSLCAPPARAAFARLFLRSLAPGMK
ncbi:MAG: glycosyltransferase family 2 protein [Acidobacteria bacterium]|nr:glycosyltransferase family 2 protein [Acidobacteriota bacterium]